MRERLKKLAGQAPRHGYRALHSRLLINGWPATRPLPLSMHQVLLLPPALR